MFHDIIFKMKKKVMEIIRSIVIVVVFKFCKLSNQVATNATLYAINILVSICKQYKHLQTLISFIQRIPWPISCMVRAS